MDGHSSLQTPNSLHISSIKTTSSSSLASIMKLQTFIFSHIYRISHSLNKAKSLLLQLIKQINSIQFPLLKKSKKNKLFFGSFRLHYNWCSSSNVMPVYYDSISNSMINPTSFKEMQEESNELSGYLKWLEEKENNNEECSVNEIDKLADLFIANCHEKFRLEKVESYRRYQEMLARSV